MIAAVGSVLLTPWNLYKSPETIHYTLDTLGAFIGPLFGVLIAHYYVVHKQRVCVDDLFTMDEGGAYHYKRGYNPPAIWATAIAAAGAVAAVFVPGINRFDDYSLVHRLRPGLRGLRPARAADGCQRQPARREDVCEVTVRLTVVNPNTTESMTALIEAEARRVAGPDTVVTARTPSMGPASIESHYDEALAVPGLLEVIRADQQADAFVLACFGDPGLDAAREAASRPVIGIAEAAMKTASLLGRSFSVVTTMSRTVGRAWDLTRTYGLERQCAGVHACDIPVLELEEDRDRTYAVILAFAKNALAADGSDAIVLGCAGMAGLPELLTEQLGVPVVDGVAAGTLLAESVVRLGLHPSTHGELAPPPPKAYTGVLQGFGRT